MVAGAALVVSALGTAPAAGQPTDDCRSVEDPLAELFEDDEQCVPRPATKVPKSPT